MAPNDSEQRFISLADASKKFGINKDYLRYLIFKKKIPAIKSGSRWTVTERSVEEYAGKFNRREKSIYKIRNKFVPKFITENSFK